MLFVLQSAYPRQSQQYPQIGTFIGIQGVLVYAVSCFRRRVDQPDFYAARFRLTDHDFPLSGRSHSQSLPSRLCFH